MRNVFVYIDPRIVDVGRGTYCNMYNDFHELGKQLPNDVLLWVPYYRSDESRTVYLPSGDFNEPSYDGFRKDWVSSRNTSEDARPIPTSAFGGLVHMLKRNTGEPALVLEIGIEGVADAAEPRSRDVLTIASVIRVSVQGDGSIADLDHVVERILETLDSAPCTVDGDRISSILDAEFKALHKREYGPPPKIIGIPIARRGRRSG